MSGGRAEDVRSAVPEDRAAIESLCRQLHAENGMFGLSENKLQALLDRAFNRQFAVLGVIGPVGEPVASIYLAIEQPYYSDDYHLLELWSHVHPDHRKSKHAQSLIDFAKICADQLRVPLIIGIVSNHRTEAKVRLYQRQLQMAGAYFSYPQGAN